MRYEKLKKIAMDLEEVYMTQPSLAVRIHSSCRSTCGKGINTGSGIPILKDECSVHYIWDNIIPKKDSVLEGLNQNQDFFSLLLGNNEIKKEVLGIFAEEIYDKIRENAQ